jgi:hypothetical protein
VGHRADRRVVRFCLPTTPACCWLRRRAVRLYGGSHARSRPRGAEQQIGRTKHLIAPLARGGLDRRGVPCGTHGTQAAELRQTPS